MIHSTKFWVPSLAPSTAQLGFLHQFQYGLSYAMGLEKLGLILWICRCLGTWKH